MIPVTTLVLLQMATAIVFSVTLATAVTIYGDIHPNTRTEASASYHTFNSGSKCYKDVPALLYQTQENESVQGNATTSTDFLLVEVCCEGYKRAYHRGGECIADCSEISPTNCRHGFCRTPRECECYEGFVKNAQGNCVQTCPVSCENGRCRLDGSCICQRGYYLDVETGQYCLPDCSYMPCGLNQICLAPGKCGCVKGYKWLKGLGCQPICEPHCGYGRCVAPGECECFAGFMKRPLGNICEADCSIKCDNGFCESRYKCQCHLGFHYASQLQTCLPSCPQGCEHGTCIAPGICRCFEGYYLDDNTCLPICEPGCGFGHCVAPNVCACGAGGQKCLGGGRCSALGKCHCPAGKSHFIDRCVVPSAIADLMYNIEDRDHMDKEFRDEFEALLGSFFKFLE